VLSENRVRSSAGEPGRLRDRGIGSEWRLLPDLHVGIVSLRTPNALERMVDMVRPVVTTRVGVSPVYAGLEKTTQAMHLARIAMASIAKGDPQLCVFDDAPVPALIASAPTGRSVDNPLGAVELYIAMQTILRLPKPAE
jgi:hypothetical protein